MKKLRQARAQSSDIVMGKKLAGSAKDLIRQIFASAGLEIKRISNPVLAGSAQRPVGVMDLLLEDLRARGLRCESIMDVGANQGNWSRMARQIFPEAQFTLIEPLIEMKPALERFCADHPEAFYLLAGAGAANGTLVLTVYADDLVGSSFLPKPDESLLNVGKQREIKIIAIDDLISSNACPTPDLLKLDVQGFELEALKGASSTFGKTAAYILEVSFFPFYVPEAPVFHEVVYFMKQRGYVAYDFAGFQRRPSDGALGQCDICFVQENGVFRTL